MAAWADMPEDHFKELLRLSRMYYREAKRCVDAKAHLAGCIVAGSALETQLTAMVHIYADEVEQAGLVVKRRGAAKPLLDWTLADLLKVAAGMKWLPRGLKDGEKWNRRRAQIGDYAEVMRHVRNLVHPARYLRDHSPSRITRKYVAQSLEVLELAVKWLEAVVHRSLRESMEQGAF
jgi:hypothetical protein